VLKGAIMARRTPGFVAPFPAGSGKLAPTGRIAAMADSYMQERAQELAQHLKLNDGKSGYVEATADGFRVYVRRKWPGKQLATWDGLPIEWHENVGTHKAANR
jgi:hypothetical protein